MTGPSLDLTIALLFAAVGPVLSVESALFRPETKRPIRQKKPEAQRPLQLQSCVSLRPEALRFFRVGEVEPCLLLLSEPTHLIANDHCLTSSAAWPLIEVGVHAAVVAASWAA